jgi:four helix bundle protein
MYNSFIELNVWKECRILRKKISALVIQFPVNEKYNLTNQILRASKSPCANIAEGHGRFHYQENIQFCRIARGSLYETLNHLTDALDNEYISSEQFNEHEAQVELCIKLTNGYISFLEKQKEKSKSTNNS